MAKKPIIGIAGCCARAASGDVAVAARSAMNSRRFMCLSRGEEQTLPEYAKAVLCGTAKLHSQCPLWVKTGHWNSVVNCPLCAKSGHRQQSYGKQGSPS